MPTKQWKTAMNSDQKLHNLVMHCTRLLLLK